MKTLIPLLVAAMILPTIAHADLEILWENVYTDLDPLNWNMEIRVAANGDFVFSEVTVDDQLAIIRIDPDGNIVNQLLFGADVWYGVAVPVFGGGYVGGYTIEPEEDEYYAKVFRADEDGNILWITDLEAEYGFRDIFEAPDGRFVIVTIPRHGPYNLVYDDDIIVVSADGGFLDGYFIPENPFVPWDIETVIMRKDGTFRSYGIITGIDWTGTFRLDHILGADPGIAGDFIVTEITGFGPILRFCNTPFSLGEAGIYSDPVGGFEYQTRAIKITDNGGQWDRNLEPGTTEVVFYDICPIRDGGYMTIGQYQGYQVIKALFERSGHIMDQYSLGTNHNRLYRINLALDGTFIIYGRYMDDNDQPMLMRVRVNETFTPVNINIGIKNGPVHLPAAGGEITFRTTIGNDLDAPLAVTVKLQLYAENGTLLNVTRQPLTLQPNEPVWYDEGLIEIPPELPAGQYTLVASLREPPNHQLHASKLIFWKDDGVATSEPHGRISGTFFNKFSTVISADAMFSGDSINLPAEYALTDAYPNPFNAGTRFSVTLPEISDLSVRVHNTTGQLVAVLAEGMTADAGTYEFALSADELASGIYFVQATVPGKMNEIRKLVLVK